MKKIAVLNCLRANEVCAGVAWLQAWNIKGKAFARYAGQEAELAAFMRCNGCGKDPRTDRGMREKLDRLVSIGADAVHLGVCTKKRDGTRCPTITAVVQLLRERGIPCIDGTH